MSISLDEVRQVAELARLGMTEEELLETQLDLTSMLEEINVMQELDTEGVTPTIQVTGMHNVWREDEVEASLPQDVALDNAADSRFGFFAVAAIMGGDEGESA